MQFILFIICSSPKWHFSVSVNEVIVDTAIIGPQFCATSNITASDKENVRPSIDISEHQIGVIIARIVIDKRRKLKVSEIRMLAI